MQLSQQAAPSATDQALRPRSRAGPKRSARAALRRPRLGFCKKFLDDRFLSPCNQKKPGRKQPPGTRIPYGVGPRGIIDQLYAVASTTDLSGARPCVTVAQEQISKCPDSP